MEAGSLRGDGRLSQQRMLGGSLTHPTPILRPVRGWVRVGFRWVRFLGAIGVFGGAKAVFWVRLEKYLLVISGQFHHWSVVSGQLSVVRCQSLALVYVSRFIGRRWLGLEVCA